MGPAKDKHGVRESKIFIREEWPFQDKGILINNHIFNFSPLDSGWVSDPQGLGSHKASHHPGLKTVFSHHLDLSWKNAIMIDKILTMKGLVGSSPLMTDELL